MVAEVIGSVPEVAEAEGETTLVPERAADGKPFLLPPPSLLVVTPAAEDGPQVAQCVGGAVRVLYLTEQGNALLHQ